MNLRHLVSADLNLLLVFNAIWRERSITRAAAWLRVTQPAVSHALGRLRILVGDPLFVKGGSGVTPTPRAEQMAEDVLTALNHTLNALVPADAFDPTTAKATIRLGLTDYATSVVLPPVMRALQEMAPGLEIRGIAIDARNPLADLDDDVADLVFGPASGLPERFSCQPILQDRLVCVADDTGDLPKEMSLGFYLSRPHLVISYTGDPLSWSDALLETKGKARKIGLVVPHGLAVGESLRGSGMIATLIERVAYRIAEGGGLSIYDHPLEERRMTTHQTWHKRLDADPLHQWFRETVRQVHEADTF
ncbi:MAG: LysR substrate-binding domain-containing protein [Pseudomonadota bacterium]